MVTFLSSVGGALSVVCFVLTSLAFLGGPTEGEKWYTPYTAFGLFIGAIMLCYGIGLKTQAGPLELSLLATGIPILFGGIVLALHAYCGDPGQGKKWYAPYAVFGIFLGLVMFSYGMDIQHERKWPAVAHHSSNAKSTTPPSAAEGR